jgi:hypothetical protein
VDNAYNKLKEQVILACQNPEFRHHDWFVTYHLEIVERIARELLQRYADCDRDMVLAMVWIHDYSKIINFNKQYDTALLQAGEKKLAECGYEAEFAQRVIEAVGVIDRSREVDLAKESLEIQIVASADAASHYVGPFIPLWWWENHQKSIADLQGDLKVKLAKDLERKMVLPEVKQAFAARIEAAKTIAGELPDQFLS